METEVITAVRPANGNGGIVPPWMQPTSPEFPPDFVPLPGPIDPNDETDPED